MRLQATHIDLSQDGQTVTLGNEIHRHSFPVADLPEWIRIYNHLRDRKDGQFARFYTGTCDRLAAFAATLPTPHGGAA
jgi:hypothetical protein